MDLVIRRQMENVQLSSPEAAVVTAQEIAAIIMQNRRIGFLPTASIVRAITVRRNFKVRL